MLTGCLMSGRSFNGVMEKERGVIGRGEGARGRREVEGCGREDDGWKGKYATLAFRAEDCMMLLGVK